MGKVLFNVKKAVENTSSFQNRAEVIVKKNYLENKDRFFNEFNNHPVTQEIEAGPTASNSSKTLNGMGNLFSYIGFFANQMPIQELRQILEKSFSFRRKNNTKFIIEYPDLNTIKSNTPMPWEGGRSWVLGIEKGISGFGNYMYKKFTAGRSEEALQTKNKIRGSSFKRVRYMSEMIKKFVNNTTR